jgi:hypothetical protein
MPPVDWYFPVVHPAEVECLAAFKQAHGIRDRRALPFLEQLYLSFCSREVAEGTTCSLYCQEITRAMRGTLKVGARNPGRYFQ